jgi:Tfp pilus assembly protein PilF
MILQAQGNAAEARKRYEQALASDQRAGVAANNLALLYVDSGENLDMALQLAQTAVGSMPEVPEILDTLGWIYYKKNLPNQAIPQLTKAVDKQPKNPVFLYHLGLAQVQARDPEAGRQSLGRALKLKSDFAGADDARRVMAQPLVNQ